MPTLNPDDERYYQNYFDMFGSDGWRQLIDDMSNALENDRRTAVQRCKTNDEWQQERGMQVRTMKFLAFENLMRQQYDAMVRDLESEPEEGSIEEGLITE